MRTSMLVRLSVDSGSSDAIALATFDHLVVAHAGRA
jgi:hypothetical protein